MDVIVEAITMNDRAALAMDFMWVVVLLGLVAAGCDDMIILLLSSSSLSKGVRLEAVE